MASALGVPTLTLFFQRNETLIRSSKFPISSRRDKWRNPLFVAKAVEEKSNSSSSNNVVNNVLKAWNKPEERVPLVGLGFAAIIAFWASSNLIEIIDRVPFLPSTLEFIGILFSWWFIYRYLLFKPDREELLNIIKNSITDVLGQ